MTWEQYAVFLAKGADRAKKAGDLIASAELFAAALQCLQMAKLTKETGHEYGLR